MALVLVVGSMLVLAMLALTALAFTVQSQKFARYTQDYTGAMAAAQSGIEDLISRLNRDDRYADDLDCSNPAMQRPMTDPNPCGWDATTSVGWLPVVPGETDPKAAHFHYELDGSLSLMDGTVQATVTGRVNGEYRTLETTVGKGGSTDYVYYTDFESADPSNVQAYPTGAGSDCGGAGYEAADYWYDGRSGCVEITFGGGDVLDGAVFTNDAAWSATAYGGATFLDGFRSANPGCKNVTGSPSTWNSCLRQGGGASSTADFNGKRPAHADPLYLEDTSAAFATHPGCHYYGSTRIVFNSNGTMTVWNKQANNRGMDPVAITGPTGTPSCGTLAALDSAAGATVPVPNQMVVYVGTTTAGGSFEQCNAGQIGGPVGSTLPLGTYDRSVHTGTPSYYYDTNMTETSKRCQEGNLYVEGTVKGRVSIAAAQSIIVTGDLVRAGGRNGDDILGLVATNSVEIFHPRIARFERTYARPDCSTSGSSGKSWRYCPTNEQEAHDAGYGTWPKRYTDPTTGSLNPSKGIQIAGSIQTLQHSFLVQKYDRGGHKGTLNVFGSIAQRWRGIVGMSGSPGQGYDKLYEYDRDLIYGPPPYFPRWTNARWSLRISGEIHNPATVKGS